MSNEAQYINPILQAMISSAQIHQGKEELKQRALQAKADEELRSRAQDTHEKQVEYEHQHAQDMLEAQTKIISGKLMENRIAARKHVMESLANGVDPSAFQLPDQSIPGGGIPGIGTIPQFTKPGTPEGMLTTPAGENLPVTAFPNPQQTTQLLAGRTKAVAGAQEEGKKEAEEPYLISAANRNIDAETKKLQLEHANKLAELDKIGANNINVANVHGKYMIQAEQERTAGQIKGITIAHGLGLDDKQSAVANNLEDSLINGQADWSKLTKDEKTAVQQIATAKGHTLPMDAKDYKAKLDTISSVQKLIDNARDLANRFSSDSPEGSYVGGLVKPFILGTDIKAKLDELKSDGGQLASFFDKQQRKSDAEILRQVAGVFSPTNTKAQNMANINAKAAQLNNGVKQLFAGIPDAQKNYVLGNRGITDFGGYGDTGTLPPGQRPPGIPAPPIVPKQQWVRDAQGNIIPAPPPPPANIPQGN